MLAQGTVLRNHYRIIRHLGGGAFGDTYLAEDSDLPRNNQCVVKHLKQTHTNPAVLPIARRLFKTEAQVLDELGTHNQIPRLLARFEENGEFYLVQELIDGNDLSQEIAPGKRFREDEVIKLLHDILEVLEVVHQQKIIHRDIKPQNIMRRRMDGRIVLIDFGAVKEIGSLVVNAAGEVKSTIGIGTPGYIPSEQHNGAPQLCSDIYAVGIIGIQALTGLSPQQLDLDRDKKTGELKFSHCESVSNNLIAVLSKMVRSHFSQRYPSAKEALQAIDALMPQPVHSFAHLIAKVPKPVIRGSLIGLGGLGAGILATFTLLNRPQPLNPSIASSTTPSLLQTDSRTQPDNNLTSQQFDNAASFSEGLAAVQVGGKWGYIDNQGNRVIQPEFDFPGNFSEGLAAVQIGKKFGYINNQGNRVIQPQFDYVEDFSEKLAAVQIGGKWGYIDNRGNRIIQPQVDYAGNFSEGLAVVRIGKKFGYINNQGNRVIQPQFDLAESFSEKLAVVQIGGKFGYIDNQSNLVIQPQFDLARDFSEGLAAVRIGENFGYIDNQGNRVIQPQFDLARDFSEGLAVVSIGGKWGYIDKQGSLVIQPQFDSAEDFAEGLALIKEPGSKKYKYIPKPLK